MNAFGFGVTCVVVMCIHVYVHMWINYRQKATPEKRALHFFPPMMSSKPLWSGLFPKPPSRPWESPDAPFPTPFPPPQFVSLSLPLEGKIPEGSWSLTLPWVGLCIRCGTGANIWWSVLLSRWTPAVCSRWTFSECLTSSLDKGGT